MNEPISIKAAYRINLAKIIKEKTRKHEKKLANIDKKRKVPLSVLIEARVKFRKAFSEEAVGSIMEGLGSILGDSQLGKGSQIPAEVGVAILAEKKISGNFVPNFPYVVSIVSDGYFNILGADGSVDTHYIYNNENPRYATDEEIDRLVHELNSKQLASIYAKTQFTALHELCDSMVVYMPEESRNDEDGVESTEAEEVMST